MAPNRGHRLSDLLELEENKMKKYNVCFAAISGRCFELTVTARNNAEALNTAKELFYSIDEYATETIDGGIVSEL